VPRCRSLVIGLAGEPIDEETFAATLEYLRPYLEMVEEQLGDQLTYFELLTVMAFEAFFDRAVRRLGHGLGLRAPAAPQPGSADAG
jgi:folylpolyglutamate synthase/dihydropteroate synthase